MVEDEIRHPDEAKLSEFGLGKLHPDEAREVESHVAACDKCCETLNALADDTLAELVRSSRKVDAPLERSADGFPNIEPERQDESTLPPGHAQPPTSSGEFYLPPDLAEHSRYRILELVGSGGMGTVYKAEHRLMERIVAVKVINSRLTQNAAAVERFRREVRAAARLSHPNIVTAYDAEQAGGLQLLVMEFVHGTNLVEWLRERRQLPVAEACDCVRQAALGLQHAFEFGMVHRDIKPHNLMITPSGQVKILDFGLAQLAGETAGSGLTQEGSMIGTPDYMAPEQALDAKNTDIRTDIYSLGCTFYALLTGQPPFPQGSAVVKMMAHAEREPKPVSDFRDDVPRELLAVLQKMTAKHPRERYQTPAEIADALHPFVSASAAVSGRRPVFRWKVGTVLAATLLLLAGVLFIVTDKGRVRIESFTDDVELIVSKGGREYTIIDLKTDSKVHKLRSGAYEVALKDRTDLKLSRTGFTLSRGEEVLLEVKQDRPSDAAADSPSDGSELSRREQAAHEQTIAWLKLLDDQKYAQSRDEAAEVFRSTVTAEKWTNAMTPIRKQTGRLIDRKLRQARYTTVIPGAPAGEYVLLQFDSSFEEENEAVEIVTAILERNNRWRVASYEVRSRTGAQTPPEQSALHANGLASKLQPPGGGQTELLRSFEPTDEPIQQDGMTPEEDSWKFVATGPLTARLFEVNGLDITNRRLIYRARLKSENLDGRAYLEMWVRMPEGGEFFSKALHQPVSGTTGWATYETPFFLRQRADMAKLNLVIEGKGTVWIKDVELLSAPLPDSRESGRQ